MLRIETYIYIHLEVEYECFSIRQDLPLHVHVLLYCTDFKDLWC